MSFRSGKNGRLSLGGTTFKVKRWNVEPKNQIQDVTSGNSNGFGEYIAGVSDLDFSAELDYDVGTNPFGTKFVQGTLLTAIFYVDGIGQPNWTINGIIESVSNSLDVRGLVSITLHGRASVDSGGTAWTAPTT